MVLGKLGHEIKIVEASWEVLIIESEQSIDSEKLQRTLGGVVKIVKVLDEVKKSKDDSINFALQNYFKPSKLKKDFLKNSTGKLQVGISIYLMKDDVKAFGEPKRVGMFIKRSMQDTGGSIRVVLPEFNSLSLASVAVTHNALIQKGAEICILAGHTKLYVGKTLQVQDFEDYGRRDYQRPVRDDKVGMIPPKVAQIMLNLAGLSQDDTILDPFCGFGTILQEALLLGYRVIGTDLNKKAVAASEKNLEWFRNRYKLPKGKYHVEMSDAKEVSKPLDNLVRIGAIRYISAIVTEGTLGPTYSQFPTKDEIDDNFKELLKLYKTSFSEFYKLIPPKGRVVLCLPAYKNKDTYTLFPSLDPILELGYTIVDIIPQTLAKKFKFLQITERGTAIYDRKDQIVARELVILQKSVESTPTEAATTITTEAKD